MTKSLNPGGDWYLQDWLRHFGKRQASLVNELGWTKGRAHYVWHGDTPYGRDVVNEISQWLNIEPFELLMPPEEALALRSFRESAVRIVEAAKPVKAPARTPAVRVVRSR